MLKIVYDAEIISEEAILAWADEKELAEEEEKELLKKVCAFCLKSPRLFVFKYLWPCLLWQAPPCDLTHDRTLKGPGRCNQLLVKSSAQAKLPAQTMTQ